MLTFSGPISNGLTLYQFKPEQKNKTPKHTNNNHSSEQYLNHPHEQPEKSSTASKDNRTSGARPSLARTHLHTHTHTYPHTATTLRLSLPNKCFIYLQHLTQQRININAVKLISSEAILQWLSIQFKVLLTWRTLVNNFTEKIDRVHEHV